MIQVNDWPKKLFYQTMDREQIDLKSLGKEEINYVKTTQVWVGQILCSDSRLEK